MTLSRVSRKNFMKVFGNLFQKGSIIHNSLLAKLFQRILMLLKYMKKLGLRRARVTTVGFELWTLCIEYFYLVGKVTVSPIKKLLAVPKLFCYSLKPFFSYHKFFFALSRSMFSVITNNIPFKRRYFEYLFFTHFAPIFPFISMLSSIL